MDSPTAPKPTLLRSAGAVAVMTLLSRITGVFTRRLVNHYLGAGAIADAFAVAYRLPNLLRRFTAEGTMTSAFLPTLSEVEAREGTAGGREMVARFLGTLALTITLLCAVAVLFMGFFMGLQMLGRVAPGQPWGRQLEALVQVLAGRRVFPEDVAQATTLARIMFPYLALVSVTAGISAVLNLRGRFALPASVSTFFNLAFIASGLAFMHLGPATWRDPVRASLWFAVATLLAGIVQLLVLWPSFHRLGFHIKWGFHWGHPGVRTAFRRMLPGLLGTGIHPINVYISMILASKLAVGAQTVLFNSNILSEMVLGLFSASIATVSLPAMSRLVDEGDLDGLRHNLAAALRGTAVLAIPAAVGMAVLAEPIVNLLFRTGRYDAQAVHWTASTLMWQSLGILFIATGRITAQCLYALKDYKTPAKAAFLGVGFNVVLSILLMGPMGTQGISLANGLASMAGLTLMALRVRRLLPRPPFRQVAGGWLSMGTAAGLMGLGTWGLGRWFGVFQFQSTWQLALRIFPLIAVAGLLYFACLALLRVSEARSLWGMVGRRLGRN
jgi:putative peptidoglycan lipid II flippase